MLNSSIDQDDDLGAVDLDTYYQKFNQNTDDELNNSAVDMDQYSTSPEAEEAGWWDWTKDVALQSVRGVAQAFTWPLDILKIGMVGEGLSNIDEIEETFKKEGKPFDRDKYIETITKLGDTVPTQAFLEGLIQDATGINLEPKTGTGKFVNKAATIAKLAKGSVPGRLASGAAASGTTQALKATGANEVAAELLGDVAGGLTQATKRVPRSFTPEAQSLKQIADKHGIPFYEFMTKPPGGAITPKISQERQAAIMKELGVTSEQAAKRIIEGKLPVSQLRAQGFNLNQLEDDAYDATRALAKSKPQAIDASPIIQDIDKEIARIKNIAPSLGEGNQEALKILEREKQIFEKALPGAKNPVTINTEQLINQHKEYNSNVKSIYKKPELKGREEEIRNTYAFLNDSIRDAVEKQGGADVANAFKEANKLFHQNSVLKRSEALISKAFQDGNYSPKKLKQLLHSKQGKILKKDLGDQAIKDITEIADYGDKAINHTSQILKKPQFAKDVLSWGGLAPLIIGSTVGMKGALFLAKPIAEGIKGRLLTRPATREVYKTIVKNAAKGSFKNMASDFGKLEDLVIAEYGGVDQFVREMINELEVDDEF